MNQNERHAYLLMEVTSAHAILQRNQDTGEARDSELIVGALTGMLAGMAGLGEFATHGSCFDQDVTEAIRELVTAINQR